MAAHSNSNNIGSSVIDFALKGIDEKNYSLQDFSDKKILVIIFQCNHCPYVMAIEDRLVEFQNRYKDKSVQLVAINPNDSEAYPEDSFENMKHFAVKYKLNFPYLIDETQSTARKYDAACTPDIFVYDGSRTLKYRGRFDDSWKDESKVIEKDLEKAVDSLLAGQEIDFQQVPAIGCSIKWKGETV